MPRRMRGGGHGGHVVHGAGAVVHVREHQHRHVVLQGGGDVLGFEQHQFQATLAAQAFGNVEVGGEVAALAEQLAARRRVGPDDVERRAQHLVEVDGGGVGAHHFARPGANQRRKLVAQALWQIDPAGVVPRADQALRPFLLHHLGHAGGSGFGRDAQRIAVQVNDAARQREVRAQAAQRVLRIQGAAVLQGGHI